MKTKLLFITSLLYLTTSIKAQESWVPQNSGLTTRNLFSVDFLDTNTGYVDCVRKTTNGGATWTNPNTEVVPDMYSIDFLNANTGFAVGGGAMVKTTNGGATWGGVSVSNMSGVNLNSVRFMNATAGWAVGYGYPLPNSPVGLVVKTTNGGNTWTGQYTNSRPALYSVYFVDANTGWAVGDSGIILKTVNGGTNWTRQSIGRASRKSYPWRSVYFMDTNVGWVIGESDSILKTTDGGSSWVAQFCGNLNARLFSLQFVDQNAGWIVGAGGSGEGGIILKTTNGGTTWIRQSTGTINGLSSVHFVDAVHGWAVGSNGTILKHVGSPTPILSKKFMNGNFGFDQHTGNLGYQLLNESRVLVLLFDVRGRLRSKLFDGDQPRGHYDLAIPRMNHLSSPGLLDLQIGKSHQSILLPSQY